MTKIVNNTPWNTEDLQRLLLPMFTGCGIMEATIELMPARTSRWSREHLSRIRILNETKDQIAIELLSPKRAAARTETLDRLSLAGDLKAHETKLPASVITMLSHGFTKFREAQASKHSGNSYTIRSAFNTAHSCLYGTCGCQDIQPVIDPPVVRGDTKVRTHPSPTEKGEDDLQEQRNTLVGLQRKYESQAVELRRQADALDKKAASYDERINNIDKRIIRVRAKAAMSVPLQGISSEEDCDGDEGQQEAG